MRVLGIDIETYSSVDLVKSGVYAYTSAPDFQILLFAYAFDEEPINIIDFASGEKLPAEIIEALSDASIIKTAFNANFERVCISRHLGSLLSPIGWQCTAVQAGMLGLPLHLEGVAKVLNLQQQKLKEGKDLIKYFSVPCKPTGSNGGRTRNLPSDNPEKWTLFKEYCIRDVVVERAIRTKLIKHPIPVKEQEIYILDQEINDRGILVDTQLVQQASICDKQHKEDAFSEAQRLTGLENPNSVTQLKEWLLDNGIEIGSLSKKAVSELVKESDGEVERLLQLRLQLAKTSIKKYEAIERAVGSDGRVRGLLQFYGANRTGRWAGRLVQVQNLPQNHIKDLSLARDLVKQGRFSELSLFYDSVPVVLSELIRTAFIPAKDCHFIVADFSAIEARVVAWLAGEAWVLDTFGSGKGIYEATAARMYGVPVETVVKGNSNYEYRQKGKQACLACGYQGGVGALKAMGAEMPEDEMQALVSAWRAANSNIVKFWYAVEKAAKEVVREKTPVNIGSLKFSCESGILSITLPSGRRLSYIKPRLEMDERFGKEALTYEGIDQKNWSRLNTYGGKLTENIVQATARDLLAEAMLRVEKAGYRIVMHVHDEVVIEAPINTGSVSEVCDIMGQTPAWAEGLPLKAEGFECKYYKKE